MQIESEQSPCSGLIPEHPKGRRLVEHGEEPIRATDKSLRPRETVRSRRKSRDANCHLIPSDDNNTQCGVDGRKAVSRLTNNIACSRYDYLSS